MNDQGCSQRGACPPGPSSSGNFLLANKMANSKLKLRRNISAFHFLSTHICIFSKSTCTLISSLRGPHWGSGFTPRPPPGLCPETPLEDFHPTRRPTCPPIANFWLCPVNYPLKTKNDERYTERWTDSATDECIKMLTRATLFTRLQNCIHYGTSHSDIAYTMLS